MWHSSGVGQCSGASRRNLAHYERDNGFAMQFALVCMHWALIWKCSAIKGKQAFWQF